jgi:hypothetical protein
MKQLTFSLRFLLVKFPGALVKRRACDSPKPVNTEDGCEGTAFSVALCKDDKVTGHLDC